MDDPQQKLFQSMARLSMSPDYAVFLTMYLQKELDKQIDGCVTAAEPAQYQGAAQALRKLINDMAKAKELAVRNTGSVTHLANAY
jgi:hypothetical protein